MGRRRRSRAVPDTPAPRRGPLCRAPSAALYLDPMGDVRACCHSGLFVLGNVTEAPLSAIWRGERAQELRRAVASGSFRKGCEICEAPVRRGDGGAYPARFAHLRPDGATADDPGWPTLLELALSNTCNLQCVACNGLLSSAIRARRERLPPLPEVYRDAFFDDLAAFLPHLVDLKLLGGEPLLAREPRRVLDMLVEAGLTPHTHVTTNGTIWSERIEAYLEALPVDVSVSIDAVDPERAAAIRVGSDLSQVLANLARFRAATSLTGSSVSITFTLMTESWDQLVPVARLAEECDMDLHVNSVHYPRGLSVELLGPERRAEIAAQIEAEAQRSGLDRTAAVVADTVARLAGAALPAVSSDGASTVAVGAPSRRDRHRPEGAPFVLDAGATILAVPADGGASLGVDVTACVGWPMLSAIGVLRDRFGPVSETALTTPEDGQEHRLIRFGDGGEAQTVIAVLADPPAGAPPEAESAWYVRLIRG